MDALRRTAVLTKSRATDGIGSSKFHHLNLFISEEKAVVSSLSNVISSRVSASIFLEKWARQEQSPLVRDLFGCLLIVFSSLRVAGKFQDINLAFD